MPARTLLFAGAAHAQTQQECVLTEPLSGVFMMPAPLIKGKHAGVVVVPLDTKRFAPAFFNHRVVS